MKNETEKTIYYISRGFVIPVQEKLFIQQYIAFFRAYLVSILKTLIYDSTYHSLEPT